ncbi:MAG: VOC family protein [Polyangiales bacterium]
MALQDERGCFCWFGLMTREPAKATAFYTEALGWTTQSYEIPGMGESTVYLADGKPFGHVVLLEHAPAEVPSHWLSYLAVADVDAACKQVEALGGNVCIPAFDLPTIGRTAVVNDPAGAAFHLFTPEKDGETLSVMGHAPGQVCWTELMVDDPEALIPFYRALFGWHITRTPMATAEYYSIELGDTAKSKVGGLMKRPPEAPAMPPHWMLYFLVPNLSEANGKVKRLGAQLLMENVDIPDTGAFSLLQDPTGAHSYLFEWRSQG